MSKVLLVLALVVSMIAPAMADEVEVKQVYNDWNEINKIYIMTDPVRHKFCYIVTPQNNAVQMFCFPIEESK